MEHELRADFLVKLLRSEEAKRNGSLLEGRALLVRLLCTLGDICGARHNNARLYRTRETHTVVAEMAVQDSRQHERLVEERVDALLIRLDTNNAVLRERA